MNTRLLILLAVVTSFGPLSMDLYLPGLPDLRTELDAAEDIAHLTVTACILGLALGQLLTGFLPDSWGRRPPLMVGMALWIAVTLCCAFAPNVWVIVGLRFAQGLGAGMAIALARTVIADLDSPNLATHLSRMMLVLAIVPVLAPGIGGVALSFTDWRGLFLGLAVVGCVLLAVIAALLPESHRASGSDATGWENLRRSARLLARPRFILPALVSGSGFGVMFTYIGDSAFVFRDGFGLSPLHYGMLFGLNAAAMMSGFQVGPALSKRWGPRRVMFGATVVGAVGGLSMVVSAVVVPSALLPIIVPIMMVLGAAGIVVPLGTAAAIDAYADESAAASGLTGAMQFMLGGVAGVIGASLPLGEGVLPMAVTSTTCFLIGASLVWVWRRQAPAEPVIVETLSSFQAPAA